jgi:membrane glycosyltransferase
MSMVAFRRILSLSFVLLMAGTASFLAFGFYHSDGIQWLDILRVVLLAISTAWLA